MDPAGNTIPFNTAGAARAYSKPMTVRPLDAAAKIDGIARFEQTGPVGSIRPVQEPSAPKPASDPSRLVASKVSPIDLSRDVAAIQGKPTPPGGYAMYRHPADQNLAATGVELGRRLDIEG